MWLEEIDEIFRSYVPYYVLLFFPIFILVSPVTPISASNEFSAYRMQHYDLNGIAYGCRSSAVNLEARSLKTWSTSRHCVVANILELTMTHFQNIKAKAGALVIILPKDMQNLSPDERQHFLSIENNILSTEVSIPIYFVEWSPSLDQIVWDLSENLDTNDLKKTATEALLSSIAANGYQVVISTSTPTLRSDTMIASIHAHLSGYSSTGKIPTIAIVAHYDSFGIAPELSFGADANGSGVIILLELIRLFSGLYSDVKTHGSYNIVFLLSGGGKINFQGSKKWLEDQLDSLESSIIHEASYVMCLDTLAASDSLYMHVSKPPKEGAPASAFFRHLKAAAEKFPAVAVEGVHKKINLADDVLAWEHERFSIRRLPAFTLSAVKSHKDARRATILDNRDGLDVDRLIRSARIVAEALGRHVYNVSDGDVFGGSWDVNRQHIEAWVDFLTVQPRSPQLLSTKDNLLVTHFQNTFNKYLREVKVSYVLPDKRDPDFQFYSITNGAMNVYSVKPAVFDLVLTAAIILYLTLIYFFINVFPSIYNIACSLTANKKVKSS